MNRRDFLRISALGAAVLTVPAREDAAAPPHPDLVAVLGPDPVRAIGAQYRRLVPAENDRLRLRAAILAPRMSIAAMVRRDFETGRTVLVNGWVLAATEARQCALFSLLA
ncbi:MAG TPA: hypothetical protein VKC15_03845 [Gemmatimonadales bacterium]|nr:hypothetical protein [Gemmatimonadales bacterium]